MPVQCIIRLKYLTGFCCFDVFGFLVYVFEFHFGDSDRILVFHYDKDNLEFLFLLPPSAK